MADLIMAFAVTGFIVWATWKLFNQTKW